MKQSQTSFETSDKDAGNHGKTLNITAFFKKKLRMLPNS